MAQPASPRTILVVDVEKFSGLDRTDSQRVTVHDRLYGVLQSAFRETGISWDDCRVEDRGDGVLILAPADIPKTRFSDELPSRLAAGLRAHNQEHSRPERMRLRMALNAGEVFFDEHGPVADAVNKTFRLLDCHPLRQALRDTPGALAMIASSWLYREVIRHSRNFRPENYSPVLVNVKETETVAWITTPGYPCPAWRRVSGEPWLIRLRDSGGHCHGPGILVCGRYVIASAQAVAKVLRPSSRDAAVRPAGQIFFDLPAKPALGVQRAEIIFWSPARPDDGPSGCGVAGLSIAGPAIRDINEPVLRFEPAGAQIVRIRCTAADHRDEPPVWARLADHVTDSLGRVQLGQLTGNMPGITSEHHGSDVIDEETGAILGIAAISAADGSRDHAWMTPLGRVADEWPLLRRIAAGGKQNVPNGMRSRPLTIPGILRLADSCLRTPALAEAQSRHLIVSELPAEVMLAAPRSSVDRADLIALLWSCAHVPGAFNELAEKVRESVVGGRSATDVANDLERF